MIIGAIILIALFFVGFWSAKEIKLKQDKNRY